LEVLYLVDYCAGRCRPLGEATWNAKKEREQEHGEKRLGDVIHGVGTIYREVVELQRLGWHEDHPARALARVLKSTIRAQQGAAQTFLGVRGLVCEDVSLDDVSNPLTIRCTCARA
jgi:hypothetical protein